MIACPGASIDSTLGPSPGRWHSRSPGRSGRVRWLAALVIAAAAVAPGAARADDEVDARLARFEAEVRQLGTDLPRPNQISGAGEQRRLVDGQLAYALGDYDGAALVLFDLANRPGPEQQQARFYLAEALFEKGDRGTAAGYYEQVIAGQSVASKYYQPALVRLVEIAIAQQDDPRLAEHVVELDRISPGLRLPSVPYVRGKLAYAQGKYDEAIGFFQDVPKGSDYELQALYYLGTTYVARRDLDRAIGIFADLINRKPRTGNDRRMVELSQLALGRLYYERDQASKSIDAYLLVDRHSDLFPDALYEVAWVYVKSRQYDKALRTLELLAASDPQSTKTPTVRILEGNLRVRKAQMVRGAQILGTTDPKDTDDPATEYDRAVQVFTETHDQFAPSYAALVQIVDAGAPPERFLSQIAGRSEHVFQAAAPLPEAAVQYLRDEPAVQRVVAVESDIEEIHSDLAETQATIARLEGVLAAGDRTAVYPDLASRRARIGQIEAALIKLRSDLADQELRLIAGSPSAGDLAGLTANRRQRVAALAQLPDPERTAETHRLENQARYDAIEDSAAEVDQTIGATQAIAVALRKYSVDRPDLPADQRRTLTTDLDDAARAAEDIENELVAVHRELQIGRDLAGIGDTARATAATLRSQARAAEDAEHKLLAVLAARSAGGDARELIARGDRAARLADRLLATEREIDGVVDQGLQEVRGTLAEARATLAAYQAELAGHEAESRTIGGAALAASFQSVKARFYDIVIRTDVGNVDVAWSQKEDIDDDLKRLNLSRQRELKQLKDEFKDVLDAGTQNPSAPKPPAAAEPPPPGPSPDKADSAVAPTVKPDAKPAKPSAARPPASKSPAAKPAARPPAPKGAQAGKGGAP
ncbi:MAG TPA: tetratricopeptide repeat protein [Kofleriaceae bacterium]|jgi:tetratricopeptide (TPR) repeat protein|nr:tetratricopeptide repeat protein [Kofleriaceae bacterium]